MVEGRVARALGGGAFTFRERHVLESGYTYLGILVDHDGWFGVASVGSTSDGNTGKIAFRKRIVSEIVERVPMNAVDTRLFSDASAVAPLFRSTIANGTLIFLR